MARNLQLLTVDAHQAQSLAAGVLVLVNDVDAMAPSLEGIIRIDLPFPKFTDGRAYSLAFVLRRRRGFAGEIRATGDVLIDQLEQMQRMGFTSAVLRADQDPAHAQRQLARYPRHYQGDVVTVHPLFQEAL